VIRKNASVFLFALAACTTPEPRSGPLPAKQADVQEALLAQLDLVMKREAELRHDASPQAQAERNELHRMAAEIVARVLRINPEADLKRYRDPVDSGS
jgi:hypothetical protein